MTAPQLTRRSILAAIPAVGAAAVTGVAAPACVEAGPLRALADEYYSLHAWYCSPDTPDTPDNDDLFSEASDRHDKIFATAAPDTADEVAALVEIALVDFDRTASGGGLDGGEQMTRNALVQTLRFIRRCAP